MIEHLICCEYGHASQTPLYVRLLEHVQRGQCWIADRDYSTMDFLLGLRDCGAFFIIRQHGRMKGQLRGRQRRVGETQTGIVYEQPICLTHSAGREFVMRRITVHLYEATRDGDTEVHLLSNLPAEVDACTIADTFRSRWSIETAFAKLTTDLRCELNTLGFPKAALFSFCVAVVMYNALSSVVAALRVAHPEVPTGTKRKSGTDRTFSIYYIADEISGVSRGMSIAIGEEHWTSSPKNWECGDCIQTGSCSQKIRDNFSVAD
ncbi:transposase [Pirellulaceae bacterium]|nr:transposase [Pirellulaceae bacterium]